MEKQSVDKLQSILNEVEKNMDEKFAQKLELEKCDRVIQRLGSFSPDLKHAINTLLIWSTISSYHATKG